MRNPNPFTTRQLRLLQAVHEKIKAINDPAPEVITHEIYEFTTAATNDFGKIPKITFKPSGTRIKSDLIVNANLDNPDRQELISEVRRKYGIRKARNNEAMLFESEWNNLMLKAKKAAATLAIINSLLTTRSQPVAAPIQQLQCIVMEEYASHIKAAIEPIPDDKGLIMANSNDSDGIKSYAEQLAELE